MSKCLVSVPKILGLTLMIWLLSLLPTSVQAGNTCSVVPVTPVQGAGVATLPQLSVQIDAGCNGGATDILGARLLVQSDEAYIGVAQLTLVAESESDLFLATVIPQDPLPIGLVVVGVQFTTATGDVNTSPFFAPVNFTLTVGADLTTPIPELYEGWNKVSWPTGNIPVRVADAMTAFIGEAEWESVALYEASHWLQAFAQPPLPSFNTLGRVEAGKEYWIFVKSDVVY